MSESQHYFEAADAERATLRAAVAAVDHFIDVLPSTLAGSDRGLTEAWATLVKTLALEPARQVRDCPKCGRVGMSDATRCGHCWALLTPSSKGREDGQVAGGGADS